MKIISSARPQFKRDATTFAYAIMSTVFENFDRFSPSLDVLRKISFKALCSLSNSKEVRQVVYAFLEGCCGDHPDTPMPSDCAVVYLIGLRVAFFPKQVFKRPTGGAEVELMTAARRMVAGVFALLEEAKTAKWGTFQDASPASRAAAAATFFSYLWLYLDFVEQRKVLERRRTLTALCVAHNARAAAPMDAWVQRRCAKGIDTLLPCFSKVKLESDAEVYALIQSKSIVPIAGYPGDPALTSIPVRPFSACQIFGLGRLAYELLVDPSYKAVLPPDYFDLFEEGSFFALAHDLVATPLAVDYLLDVIEALSRGINRIRCDAAGLLSAPLEVPSEAVLVAAVAAREPLARFLQHHFDALLEMCTPPHFFTPELSVSESESAFLELARCAGEPLPPPATFVDRVGLLRADWMQFTHPFPEAHTPHELASLWVRTVRFLMWVRTSLEVEASNARIGLLRPVIDQKPDYVHTYIHASLIHECGSVEAISGFSAWRGTCLSRHEGIEDAIRVGIVDIIVKRSEFQTHPSRVLFPSYPPQLGVDDLPLTLRFDRARLSRIRSRVESAVTISALLRTVEHALTALDASTAPARLHACYFGLLGFAARALARHLLGTCSQRSCARLRGGD